MPTPVTPEFHVRATADTRCPLCGSHLSVVHRENDDEVHWGGAACPHLKPFDFHRHRTIVTNEAGEVIDVTEGPLCAMFAKIATHPHK